MITETMSIVKFNNFVSASTQRFLLDCGNDSRRRLPARRSAQRFWAPSRKVR